MLTFLRKIRLRLIHQATSDKVRRSLVGSGSAGRYLIYAVGEIALVMIGILLALQVNNWSEIRKRKILEYSTLIELQKSVESDISNIQSTMEFHKEKWIETKIIVDHLESKKQYETFLDTILDSPAWGYNFSLNTTAFELLERRGIDLISNAELRNLIVNHFNNIQLRIERRMELWREEAAMFRTYYFDLIYPRLEQSDIDNYSQLRGINKPVNYDKFLTDEILLIRLKHRVKSKIRSNAIVKDFLEEKLKLKRAIDIEISKY